ncbi:MAG TPA: hypothetical protein VN626_00995 [Clostridia bacterium]|nr:hypothetical protein [Clostridia bacterium]
MLDMLSLSDIFVAANVDIELLNDSAMARRPAVIFFDSMFILFPQYLMAVAVI